MSGNRQRYKNHHSATAALAAWLRAAKAREKVTKARAAKAKAAYLAYASRVRPRL